MFQDYLLAPSSRTGTRQAVPKCQFQTNLLRVTIQKTEQLSSTTVEAYNHADSVYLHLYLSIQHSSSSFIGQSVRPMYYAQTDTMQCLMESTTVEDSCLLGINEQVLPGI